MLEVNPRASRTVPFVAKVIGKPIAKIAAASWPARRSPRFGLDQTPLDHVGVKEAVFPFARFPGVDTVLGPEMRSTGEVMGLERFRARLRQEPARRRVQRGRSRHGVAAVIQLGHLVELLKTLAMLGSGSPPVDAVSVMTSPAR